MFIEDHAVFMKEWLKECIMHGGETTRWILTKSPIDSLKLYGKLQVFCFNMVLYNFLLQFIEQFQEVKEATRSSMKQSGQSGGTGPVTNGSSTRETSAGANIPPPAIMTGTSPYSTRNQMTAANSGEDGDHVIITNSNETNANTLLKGVSVAHQRSQSLSGVPPPGSATNTESPKHGATAGKPDLVGQSPETQLKYENERLRLALAQR